MNLFCIGVSHRTANVATRERFGGNDATVCILREAGCAEALILATCNRVEVYGAAEKRLATEDIIRCLAPIEASDDFSVFYRHENADCAQHLFRVAAGIDSMVLGETEILGQSKKAYE